MMDSQYFLDIFRQTGALLDGHFKLTSGLHSDTYFQCAKVLQHPEHLTTICKGIADHFNGCKIDKVISPAIGGIVVGTETGRQLGVTTVFAERKEGKMTLRRGFEITRGEQVLVVEDVITTGGSVAEVIEIVREHGGEIAGVGTVVDRSNGNVRLVDNQFSILSLEVRSYQPDECPLCKQGIPIDAPGSRASFQS